MSLTEDMDRTFAVERTKIGGAVVLSPTGSLTYETCTELRDALQQAAEAPRINVVLDCRQVSLIDSEALQLLTEWRESLHASDGAIRLCNLNDVCADILVVTRLIHVLAVFEDLKQAVQAGRES